MHLLFAGDLGRIARLRGLRELASPSNYIQILGEAGRTEGGLGLDFAPYAE